MAEHAGKDGVERHESDVMVRRKGMAVGDAAFLSNHTRIMVDIAEQSRGPLDLRHEGRRHDVVDEVSVVLESRVVGQELDVLLRQDATDKLTEEAAAIKLLCPSEENVLGFIRICHHHSMVEPWA